MSTDKQEKALEKMVENGGNASRAMRDVGYSENTAKTPQKLTNSKGWQTLLNERVKDKKLIDVLNDGLSAGKKIFKNNGATGKIEEVGFEVDYSIRHRYLETGLKLKRYFPSEKNDLDSRDELKDFLLKYNKILDG